MPLTLTRLGHSCVRVATTHGAFSIDPGTFSDVAAALEGVAVVLVTHVHPDHVDVDALAAADSVLVHAPAQVLDAMADAGARRERLHPVAAGDVLDIAGARVRVLGYRHEVVHEDIPRPEHVAYLVDDVVLHPGDSYARAPEGTRVDVLLEPVGAPWLRLGDVVDHVRAVAPTRVVPIHDALLSDAGRATATRILAQLTEPQIVPLNAGESVRVG